MTKSQNAIRKLKRMRRVRRGKCAYHLTSSRIQTERWKVVGEGVNDESFKIVGQGKVMKGSKMKP